MKYFVVVEEKILATSDTEKPEYLYILGSLSPECPSSGIYAAYSSELKREATKKDFEIFRINTEGFEKDKKHYAFPTK